MHKSMLLFGISFGSLGHGPVGQKSRAHGHGGGVPGLQGAAQLPQSMSPRSGLLSTQT